MLKYCLFLAVGFLTLLHVVEVEGTPPPPYRKPTKLFVFGDSYVDTGNVPRSYGSNSWSVPFGITFPGKPSGRFTDGRVLTDFVAKFLKLKSPIPYRVWKYAGWKVKYGMNFAFGGTGVFDTLAVGLPNMTTQIDFFEQLTSSSSPNRIYTSRDLEESVALVSVSGNDYLAYLGHGRSISGMKDFAKQVVKQQVLNLKRIRSLGANKVLVIAIHPLGCSPSYTVKSSYQNCNSSLNSVAQYHSMLLHKAVAELNSLQHENSPNPRPQFIVLNHTSVFTSIFQGRVDSNSSSYRFENPLEPCCMGVGANSLCGTVDANGTKLYTLCEDRTKRFFWDAFHPTQAGWETVYSMLTKTLQQLY